MNATLRNTVLAVAIGLACSLSVTGVAQAGGNHDHGGYHDGNHGGNHGGDEGGNQGSNENGNDFSQKYSLDQESTHKQKVTFDKSVKLSTDVSITGKPKVTGTIPIDSAAISIVDNRQKVHDNESDNKLLGNTAGIGDNVSSKASGNIGMNVASGDNNQQDNAAALAATDASFVFGMADGEVFVNQLGHNNTTMNEGVMNNAGIGGNAFNAASGNIGVNVTSGNNNQQKNALSASVATSDYATASVDSSQYSKDNSTTNHGYFSEKLTVVGVELHGTSSGTYNGSSTGAAYQANNIYPDMWTGDTHKSGTQTGHFDLDGSAQGAVLDPYKPGATNSTGDPIGGLSFDTGSQEMGNVALNDTLSGAVWALTPIVVMAQNSATLSGSAFQSASGNIGVNVSAGTGNQQANSLAMAVGQPTPAQPTEPAQPSGPQE